MGYGDRREVSFPEYGINIDASEPVKRVWADSDGLWITTDTPPSYMEAEQMPEYLDGEPVSVDTGDMLSVSGTEVYGVPGKGLMGIIRKTAPFSLHVTERGRLRENGFIYPGRGDRGAIANVPEPRLLKYDDPFNISYFVLEQVVDVDIDRFEDDSFLDRMGVRDSWEELLSGDGGRP